VPDFTTISITGCFISVLSLMKGHHFMKFKTIMLTLTLSGLSLFTYDVCGQETFVMSKSEQDRKDSLQKVNKVEQNQQTVRDVDRMNNVQDASKVTEANAKEAQRVEKDASNAAKESKNAVKAEKKAQKARKNADKQALKASQARAKSDNN
jgi:hypothetical protein